MYWIKKNTTKHNLKLSENWQRQIKQQKHQNHCDTYYLTKWLLSSFPWISYNDDHNSPKNSLALLYIWASVCHDHRFFSITLVRFLRFGPRLLYFPPSADHSTVKFLLLGSFGSLIFSYYCEFCVFFIFVLLFSLDASMTLGSTPFHHLCIVPNILRHSCKLSTVIALMTLSIGPAFFIQLFLI